jgi:hypothetical protein
VTNSNKRMYTPETSGILLNTPEINGRRIWIEFTQIRPVEINDKLKGISDHWVLFRLLQTNKSQLDFINIESVTKTYA